MKPILVLLGLLSGALTQLYAQEDNVFLDRSFWSNTTQIEKVDQYLAAKHDLSELNDNNFDPMVYAILQDAPINTLQYVLNHKGNDVNKVTHDGRTYVFWAAYKGNTALMKYLISKGARMDLRDDKGYTVLNFAASAGQKNTAVYDLCLAHGADLLNDVSPQGANALLLAAAHDVDQRLTSYFMAKGLQRSATDAQGHGMFSYAVSTGNIPYLKQLLATGVKPENAAVLFASKGGRTSAPTEEIYRFLSDLKLDLTTQNEAKQNALHFVAKKGSLQLINYLRNQGVSMHTPDEDGITPFHAMVQSNQLATIKAVLPALDNINLQTSKGVSPLALALAHNTPEVVAYLLSHQADVQLRDQACNSMAYYLLNFFSEDQVAAFDQKVSLLREAGLALNTPQANGNNLFHLALPKQSLALLQRVHAFGVPVNSKNKAGLTPLHQAAMLAKDDVLLKYLIQIGAKKTAETAFDETAFDLANENELLQAKQISINFLK